MIRNYQRNKHFPGCLHIHGEWAKPLFDPKAGQKVKEQPDA